MILWVRIQFMLKKLFPKLNDLLFLTLFISISLLGPRMFSLDGDLGRHIVIGDVILDTAYIPRTDLFSHTMYGEHLVPHEWLAQILFALFHRFAGLTGVVFFAAILIAGAFAIVYFDSQRRSGLPFLSLFVTFLAAFASSLHWLTRPHSFTFLYLALWVLLLEKQRKTKDVPLWMFFVIMLFWANTHGAFIAGFVSLFAYLAGESFENWSGNKKLFSTLKPWLQIAGVSLVASLLNPAGVDLWGTSVGYVNNSYLVGHTQEYFSPDFHQVGMMPFLVLIVLFIFLLNQIERKMAWTHLFLLTGWLLMGLYSARNIPLFAIVAAPIFAEYTSLLIPAKGFWGRSELNVKKMEVQGRNYFVWSLLSIALAFSFAKHPVLSAYNRFPKEIFPVDAVNWLEENEQDGNVFNYFPWGGYLLYREWPEQLVFIDGQTDFYGESLMREYETVIRLSNGWEAVLDKYKVDWALIPSSLPLADAFEADGWQVLYEDDVAILLRRK